MHTKLNKMPKNWPLPRKGKKYVALAKHNQYESMPVAVILRDILKIAKTMKEAKKICMQGFVQVNKVARKDPLFPVLPRDILTLTKTNQNFILVENKKRLSLMEISEKDSKTKVYKIQNKICLSKKTFQVNLEGGLNLISNSKFNCGDSMLIDLAEKKELKIIPLEKGSKILVVSGKHIGEQGKIINMVRLGEKNCFEIELQEGGKQICLPKQNLLAIQ